MRTSSMPCSTLRVLIPAIILLSSRSVTAGDWPMWRGDANRSAVSSETLPADLRLTWTRELQPRRQAWDDPLNLDLMTYDRIFEPIVLDGRVIVGFNDRDKVVAFDATTGQEQWTFYTDGPVRLPAAGWNGHVFFCSDDGHLYCVDVATGQQKWKFRGAAGAQKAIGNYRIVSVWPSRGGPVVRDNTVYFAASIWPMMGTFLYALDADSGQVRWVNDNTGAQYIKQPHSAPSFAGVAPQGALVATKDHLVVPGGRSVPAVFDRSSGSLQYFEINAGGKGTGGSFVTADDSRFYVHTRLKGTRAFNLETGLKTAFMPNEPVLAEDIVYSAMTGDDDVPVVRAYNDKDEVVWEVNADGSGDLILSGQHLYAAGEKQISVIALPSGDQPAAVIQQIPVAGDVQRLLAASGQLFAVTLDGNLLAFANSDQKTIVHTNPAAVSLDVTESDQQQLRSMLQQIDQQGYALWYGIGDGKLLRALAASSPFTELSIIDPDADKVDQLRRQLDAAGLYGKVTVHCCQPEDYSAPRYIAHVVIVDDSVVPADGSHLLAGLYKSVRPYGGSLKVLSAERSQQLAAALRTQNLEQADIVTTETAVTVTRVGRLPGSADWTHQYGDIANSVKSNDERVKLPLGVLWFGGSSNMDVLPRHGHGPPEQVVGGRLYIEGMNSISCRDVYTGRVLWKRDFGNLGTYDVYYDITYENTPLNPKYNQVHIPGANGRGTNYIVTEDRVYVVQGNVCHVLDAATGRDLQNIELPATSAGDKREWGYVGVYGDLLLGGFGFAMYRDRHELEFEGDKKLKRSRAGFGSKSLDRAASLGLVAFDRHTGEVLWTQEARHSFWHNGIVAGDGRIYCLDRTPELIEAALRRRGKSNADTYRIVALNSGTGEVDWEVGENVFGTWLGYSEKHNALLQAGAAASDRLYAEVGSGMVVYHAHDGSVKWQNDSLKYAGPCILHNDWIITNANSYSESAGAFHLEDGHQKMVANPLTGELQPWKITRAYGCNNIIASEHMLTFRSGAAGFYDLDGESGTGNFGGFKSGCTSNLVVANGILNAPDYTRTCSCAYQNQTSLGLIHMPELEFWTINPSTSAHMEDGQVQQVGINLGAPGDRRAADGLQWLEYPAVAGPSPLLTVTMNEDARPFRHHSSTVDRSEPWILASGIDNLTDLKVRFTIQEQASLRDGVPVAHRNDDAEEGENGDVGLTSSDLELVEDGETQLVGLRFNNINIPRGGAIRSAWIQFTCDEPSGDPASLIISAEDSGFAEEFISEKHDLSARPRTKAEVQWSPAAWKRSGAAGKAERTVDLAPLLREVTSRDDWEPGNSVAFFISGTGQRTALSRQDAATAPRLIVDADEVRPQSADQPTSTPYQVRLLFAAPKNGSADTRRFDVAVQGDQILQDVQIHPTGGPEQRFVEHTMDNVLISDELQIQLTPRQGTPVLAGVEIRKMP